MHMPKKLASAAMTLQSLFYASSESMFSFDVSKAERIDGQVYLYTSYHRDWKPPFDCPVHFALSEKEKAKILSYGCPADAHVVTQGLIQKLPGSRSCCGEICGPDDGANCMHLCRFV